MERSENESSQRKYVPTPIPAQKWTSFHLNLAHDDPQVAHLRSRLSEKYPAHMFYQSNTFKNLIKAENSFFAHDHGMMHETVAVLVGDEIYLRRSGQSIVFLSAKAFQKSGWDRDKSQQPLLAAAWVAEMVLSNTQVLTVSTPVFSLEGSPRFNPPSYIIADHDDHSILIFCWTRHAGSMVPENNYIRQCFRFSAQGHYQGVVHEFSLEFSTDHTDSRILRGPQWTVHSNNNVAPAPHVMAPPTASRNYGVASRSRSPYTGPTNTAPARPPIARGAEWNLPDCRLPPAVEHNDFETLEQVEAREEAEALRIAAEQEEAERASLEAERLEREATEREETRKQEQFINTLNKYFNIIEMEYERDEILVPLSSDIWARDAVGAVERGDAVLGEAKLFPKLYVIIMKPKEVSDPGERKGFIWNYKFHSLLGHGGIRTEPILTAAGWNDSTQEKREQLMIEMVGVMYGGYQKAAFLLEPTAAFSLPGAPAFTKPFVLRRKRYFVYWVHIWTRHESSYGSTGFERVCFGFDGDTAGLQGVWHNRFVNFRTDSAETEILTHPQWSYYEYQKDDKSPPFDGREETWPEWEKEME